MSADDRQVVNDDHHARKPAPRQRAGSLKAVGVRYRHSKRSLERERHAVRLAA